MKKWFSVLCIILLILTAFPALAQETAGAPAWRAYNGKRLGVLTGTLMEDIAYINFPDSEYLLLNSYPDCIAALLANKIDAYLSDELNLKTIHAEQPKIDYIHERITNQEYSFAFRKNDRQSAALCAELNAFLALCHEDGTMRELDDIWFGVDEARKVVDMSDLTGEKGTIRVVTTSTDMPWSYIKDGKNVGYDIDLVVRFCRYAGYKLELGDVDFAARIPAIQSGKYDFTTDMNVTEERKEQVLFSDPTCSGGVVLAILTDGSQAETHQPAPAVQTAGPGPHGWNGKRMGIVTGTSFEAPTLQYFPDSQHLYFSANSDVVTALTNNKIDGFLGDEPVVRIICKEVPQITYLPDKITQDDYAFGFGKNSERSDKIRGEFNEMLAQIMADGTLNALCDKWFGDDENAKSVDLTGFSGKNGTLKVVTESTSIPFSYIKDGELTGIAIELTEMFCRRYGYTPVIEDVDAAARIPGLVTGKYDMCASPLTITEERRESINFSDPYYQGGIVLAVRKADLGDSVADPDPFARFSGKRIGVGVGTANGQQVEAKIPDAILSYYNNQADLLAALRANKIDAWGTDETVPKFMMMENDDLMIVDGYLDTFEYAPIFAKTEKGRALRDQYNAFVDSLWADGTMQELDEIWYGKDEAKRTVLDYGALPATNGTLRMAVDTSVIPFAYMKDNRVVGYDVDIAARFCEANGYQLEVQPMDFGGILAAVQSGKVDFSATGITVTEERKESVLFGSADYKTGAVLAVVKPEYGQDEPTSAPSGILTLNDLATARIGVQTGTPFDEIVLETLPNAQISYFNSYPDMAAALESNKIDGFPGDEPVLQLMAAENPKLGILSERMDSFEFGFVLPKTEAGEALQAELDAWIASIQESGELAKTIRKWTEGTEDDKTVPDYGAFPATKGTLKLATEGAYAPMNYYRENEVVGMEIDMAAQFCEANGYGLTVEAMNFDGILSAVQAGKADFAAAGISITEERKESVNFSAPYYTGGTVMAVLKAENAPVSVADGVYNTLDELNGRNIGVQTGQSFDAMISARLPEATLTYYNNKADLINALTTGKIVSFAADEPVAKVQMQENDKLTYVPEYLDSFEFGYVFAKTEEGAKLRDQMNEYLKTIQADGTLAEIDRRWFSQNDADKTLLDYKSFPAVNGTLHLATEALYEPFSYIKNNEIVGYDIDIIVRFCEACGYGLEIEDMNFSGILPSVQSEKSDIGCAGITITAERAESVYFSDPNYSGGTVMMVLKAEAPAAASTTASGQTESFWESIKASFNKTFLRENRWKLFLEGIGNTMLITLLSILFGTILGFVVFMLCRNGNLAANGATRFSIWLVTGTPMVVLLMILYYIIFGSVAISGIAVAVIGFTLTFGAAVFSLLKMGVGTIDRGQYEAAYALGHSNRHTFFKIILPQAIPHVLPAYHGEIVGLIKATAIVGYIAVQDLTKMGDIVRSRTYEAFFPLIAVTVIYFVLEGLFGFAVSRIRISIDPKKRKRDRILKGVNIHD